MGITPLALLLDELTLLDERIDELLEETTLEETLEETTLLDEERILEELKELLLIELEIALELNAELETPQLPTTPNGEGWPAQVETAIQLLLFS